MLAIATLAVPACGGDIAVGSTDDLAPQGSTDSSVAVVADLAAATARDLTPQTDTCTMGQCGCGNGPACPQALACNGGRCICDNEVLPEGLLPGQRLPGRYE